MAAMNPKVAAIMARLETDEKQQEVKTEPQKVQPPTTLEEFMKAEGLDEWPQRLTSEGALDLQSEALLLGSQEDIAALLRESAPLGLYMLEDLESRLDKLEDKLRYYASQIVTEEKPEEREEVIPFGVNKAFITQIMDMDIGKSHDSRMGKKALSNRDSDFAETMKETRKKTLEYCQFPGFQDGELIELPGQLEAPPILHRVTKAQNFNPGFRKFWKKLFLSEASVAVMQDTFWWFYLHTIDQKRVEEKNKLYDRIADSFVALFGSIHKDVKDKFLSVYPDCLAQAIYMAYWEAFTESRGKMEDNFKQNLINCVSEWITGLKPVPGSWKSWNIQKMEAKVPKGLERDGNHAVIKMMQAAVMNKDMNLSLDMDSFNKMMSSLGEIAGPPSTAGPTPQEMTRDLTRLTNFTNMTNGLSVNSHNLNLPMKDSLSRASASRLATCGSSLRKPINESHQMGPGPEYERVLFNTSGRSPLISHYLHMRQLRDFKQSGKRVRRTEIAALPAPGPTYQQLIQNKKMLSETLKREYEKICEQTQKDILEIEKKRIETNREINNITKELMTTRNPLDLKILSERIIAIRERDREIALLDKDSDKPAASDIQEDDEF